MDEDYYSIPSILAENHKVTCTFLMDVEGLGYLEGGTEADIQQDAKIELPFWLAQTLSINDFTSFPLPAAYSKRVQSALNASAPSVRLANLVGGTGWWYAWGRRIAAVLDDEQRKRLLETLSKAFINRLPSLQDLSAHHASKSTANGASDADNGNGEGFRDGMEGEERELFAVGQESGRRMKLWYDGSSARGGQKAGR